MAPQSQHSAARQAHAGCVKPLPQFTVSTEVPRHVGWQGPWEEIFALFLICMLNLLGFVVNKSIATEGIQEIHFAPIFLLTFVGLCTGDSSSFLGFSICYIMLESTLWLTVFHTA